MGQGDSQAPVQKLSFLQRPTQPHPFGHSPLQSSSVGDLLCACTTLDARGKGLGRGPCLARTLGPVEKEQTRGECRNVSACRSQRGRIKARVSVQGADTHRNLNRTESGGETGGGALGEEQLHNI